MERKRFPRNNELHGVSNKILTADGRNLAYQIHGPSLTEDAFPVFFMHGNPGSRLGPFPRNFELLKLNISIIAPDRPGYGQSDRQPGRLIADTAHDIAALADALNIERFAVMGRSGGVAHALACAALLGERVYNVSGLAGIAPPDKNFNRFEGMVSKNADFHYTAQQSSQALEAMYQELAAKVTDNPASFLKDFLWDQLTPEDKEVFLRNPTIVNRFAETYYEALAPQQAAGWVDDTLALNNDWGYILGDIHQPTLLWHGEYDTFSSARNSLMIAKRIREGGNPSVEVVVAPSQGHFDSLGALTPILARQRDKASGLR